MKVYLLLIAILIGTSVLSQSDLDESINKILDDYVNSYYEPGLTVGVVKNGALIFQGNKGSMNLEYNLPFNDSTVFDLASVTKQFTSACIGVLDKQGKLSIDDDVRKYIPELKSYEHTIRIKHLLNHTSGIRNHNVLLDLKGFDYKHQGYTNEMIQELMFKQKGINNIPGEKVLYSNTNYVLLKLIIERVSGRKIHEFSQQELFAPLEMTHTFYRSNLEEVIENRAYSYYKNNETYQQPKSLTLCVGAGGMGSTIEDLAKWSDVFLNPNHKFHYLKEFITELDTLNNGELMKHARGMFVAPYKGYTSYNHSGRDLGMRSQFICIPDKNLAIIVFTNSEHINAVNISYQILDLFLEGESIEQKENQFSHSVKQLREFEGAYQELNSDLTMKVFVENDTLKAISSFGRDATPLISTGVNSLARIDNPSIVYTFHPNEKSDIDLYVDFGGAGFYFERITLELNPNQNLVDYIGSYYADELDVTYFISIENNKLVLSYPNNENITIKEGVTDTFGANRRTKYSFHRNNEGKVISFEVASEGTVKEIFFSRIN
ncbi:MAG: serine hydrolase domain-containing protein [Lewinella sp.]|uniref:serine hydrolase domain-containing protein n=1 Tax=Lewinella sp. TaxID=2004506 RepID=UPI003D6B2DBC